MLQKNSVGALNLEESDDEDDSRARRARRVADAAKRKPLVCIFLLVVCSVVFVYEIGYNGQMQILIAFFHSHHFHLFTCKVGNSKRCP